MKRIIPIFYIQFKDSFEYPVAIVIMSIFLDIFYSIQWERKLIRALRVRVNIIIFFDNSIIGIMIKNRAKALVYVMFMCVT